MTNISADTLAFETAARSAAAKLQAFHEGLTHEEHVALNAALRRLDGRHDGAEDVAGHQVKLEWKPTPLECVLWQERMRSLVEILTFGIVSEFTPDCSYMPPPSQPA